MSSSFKFHGNINEIVPMAAQYDFPTTSVDIDKKKIKIFPRSGQTYAPGGIIRIDFSPDGYMNSLNSYLNLEVNVTGITNAYPDNATFVSLPNEGGHGFISRLRILYGSKPIEDIRDYSTLARLIINAGVQQDHLYSTGNCTERLSSSALRSPSAGVIHNAIGLDVAQYPVSDPPGPLMDILLDNNDGILLPNRQVSGDLWERTSGSDAHTRQPFFISLPLLCGILNSKKLIPLQWMAGQFTIEITLASAADALITNLEETSYEVTRVNYETEILVFGKQYDDQFEAGLNANGIPFKFSSFNLHKFPVTSANSTYNISDKSRSIKDIFAVFRDSVSSRLKDSNQFYHDLTDTTNGGSFVGEVIKGAGCYISSFQARLASKYYPAQPVNCESGASEAFWEYLKAIGIHGDYSKASSCTYQNWTFNSEQGGSTFCMAVPLDHSSASPDMISGSNAQEFSSLQLITKGSTSNPPVQKNLSVFVHYDKIMILKPMNKIELVQ